MPKPITPKKASNLLIGKGASSLQPLLSYANYLQKQSDHLRNSLSEPFASHIALANIRNGIATIMVDSSTWLGKIRYLAPTIQQILSQQGLQISKVEFKADPNKHAEREFQMEAAVMSQAAGDLLEKFAESIDDAELQSALKRLAKHGKNRSST